MKSGSTHLETIMTRHNRTANIQVVFCDIEKYSQRRTLTQIEVIDAFTSCLNVALKSTAKQYLDYAQKNEVNFQNDIISLPTGDGAAIVFSFDGLHDIHLFFSKELLRATSEHNAKQACDKFTEHGWCNCHCGFNIRIGASEGKGIIFRDLNGGYNSAGSVLNMAARVMGLVDRNQIIFTQDAYRQIVDMVDDPLLTEHFIDFGEVEVKHKVKLHVFQYIDKDLQYINSNPPEDLVLKAKAKTALKQLSSLGIPMLADEPPEFDKKVFVDFIEKFGNMLAEGNKAFIPKVKEIQIDQKE